MTHRRSHAETPENQERGRMLQTTTLYWSDLDVYNKKKKEELNMGSSFVQPQSVRRSGWKVCHYIFVFQNQTEKEDCAVLGMKNKEQASQCLALERHRKTETGSESRHVREWVHSSPHLCDLIFSSFERKKQLIMLHSKHRTARQPSVYVCVEIRANKDAS